MRAWVDGRPATDLPLTDRGLHYGDGVFETIKVVANRAPLLARHLDRLAAGANTLGLRVDVPAVAEEIADAGVQLGAGIVKLIVTRAGNQRGYRPPADGTSRRILLAFPATHPPPSAAPYQHGVSVTVCRTRLAAQPDLAGVKHLCRLEQVLAQREFDAEVFAEGLMLDHAGHLIEGTSTNLFVGDGSRLRTPRLIQCGVAGVMRGLVLENRPGIEDCSVTQEDLVLDDLINATECLLTNSLIGAWPVAHLHHPGGTHEFPSRALANRINRALAGQFGFFP